MAFRQTPSQTVGPYFAYGLTPQQYGYDFASIATPVVADETVSGQRIRIVGRVFDGAGAPVNDAMIEIWQADGQGRYAAPGGASNAAFRGFGRCGTGTDPQNRYFFDTVKPGAVGDGQAPHVAVTVFMRGLLTHAYTRIYFSDEAEANAGDPVLASVPAERRDTLIAKREEGDSGIVYRFDIHMQGERETVFFDV
ncbi:protocatechuate 3,4-dioxygenase subunit alpha [Arenibaculum pallidiluteum]|uniref:protocatechuate 3,4-dioxygenase subunit alpha n=1 Tax=Arenibaculum pallidiluteum TaxID=2812559 RepID=UPI001A9752C8|nr:protocatechuate 3,4-dioxygenase subunit alpha [Arenibaculum pallidiluteum]